MKVVAAIVFVCLVYAPHILAQELTLKDREDLSYGEKDGLVSAGVVGGGINFVDSRDVPGVASGVSQLSTAMLDVELVYKRGRQHWTTELEDNTAFQKAPNLPRAVKTADELSLSTLYVYSFSDGRKLGPYARGAVKTNLFDFAAVSEEPTVYVVSERDGTSRQKTDRVLDLGDSFGRITTRESLGLFYGEKWSKGSLEGRLGFGFEQFFVKDGERLAADDKTTDGIIEVGTLAPHHLAGLELGLASQAKFSDKSGMKASYDVLIPFAIEESRLPEGAKESAYATWNSSFSLYANVLSWLSLNLDLKATRQPLVQERTQITQSMSLQAQYTFL